MLSLNGDMSFIKTIIICLIILIIANPNRAYTQSLNVKDHGAIADGKTDCTAIFQKALNEAGRAGGGVVEVPAGKYRINGHIRIPANVTLKGVFTVPPTARIGNFEYQKGSLLLTDADRGNENGEPFIRLDGNNACISGLAIVYPEWNQTNVPPVPYPPCVFSQDTCNVGIQDCLLLNPYEGIRLIRAHRHVIRNVNGYPIKRGLYVDECYDIGRIENVHFWPFGVNYDAENPYCKWINLNGIAFEFARTDWQYVLNTFCFGYGIGYKFSSSAHGSANGNFVGLGADSCQKAVLIEQAQPPGLLFLNGEFVGRWNSSNSVCMEISANVIGKVSLANCSFWGPIDKCVWMRSPSGQFTANACNFVQWDISNIGSPAIQLDAGKAIIQGCTFGQDKLHIMVETNFKSAIIIGNQATAGLRVQNNAGKNTILSLNEEDSIQWSDLAKANYKLIIGMDGDSRYLINWHDPEHSDSDFRWTTDSSKLVLPVNPKMPYKIAIRARVPAQAVSLSSGIYVNNKMITAISNGITSFYLPPVKTNKIVLELKSNPWIPQKISPTSKDPRKLGIQVFEVSLSGPVKTNKVFLANTGQWLTQ